MTENLKSQIAFSHQLFVHVPREVELKEWTDESFFMDHGLDEWRGNVLVIRGDSAEKTREILVAVINQLNDAHDIILESHCPPP